MARMWKVPETDCARSFAWNARHVLAVRVAEVYAHAGSLGDPVDGHGHHDLRISIKRLRYSLEFFSACYDPADVAVILDALATIQDLLGDLHDAEVLIPELQQVYGQLAAEQRRTACGAATGRGRPPVSFEAFEARLARQQGGAVKADLRGRLLREMHEAREPVKLFDLETDPLESSNVAAAHPDVVAALRLQLAAIAGGTPEAAPVESDEDAALEEQLRALGYLT